MRGGADTNLAAHLTIPAARLAAPTQRRVARPRAAARHDRHAWLQPLDASERAAATVVTGTTADPDAEGAERAPPAGRTATTKATSEAA